MVVNAIAPVKYPWYQEGFKVKDLEVRGSGIRVSWDPHHHTPMEICYALVLWALYRQELFLGGFWGLSK